MCRTWQRRRRRRALLKGEKGADLDAAVPPAGKQVAAMPLPPPIKRISSMPSPAPTPPGDVPEAAHTPTAADTEKSHAHGWWWWWGARSMSTQVPRLAKIKIKVRLCHCIHMPYLLCFHDEQPLTGSRGGARHSGRGGERNCISQCCRGYIDTQRGGTRERTKHTSSVCRHGLIHQATCAVFVFFHAQFFRSFTNLLAVLAINDQICIVKCWVWG